MWWWRSAKEDWRIRPFLTVVLLLCIAISTATPFRFSSARVQLSMATSSPSQVIAALLRLFLISHHISGSRSPNAIALPVSILVGRRGTLSSHYSVSYDRPSRGRPASVPADDAKGRQPSWLGFATGACVALSVLGLAEPGKADVRRGVA